MVEPDPRVVRAHKGRDGLLKEGGSCIGVGQFVGIDHTLVYALGRQVRIAKAGDSIRLQRQRQRQRAAKRFSSLPRQAINEVDVDLVESGRASRRTDIVHQLRRGKAWIGLHRELGVVGKVKTVGDQTKSALKLSLIQQVECAAAPVHLRRASPRGQSARPRGRAHARDHRDTGRSSPVGTW